MFWNRRTIRIGVGLALLALGIAVILPGLTGHTSLDGIVNARFVSLASPIAGTVLNTPPSPGTETRDHQRLLSISNERVNRLPLTELAMESIVIGDRLKAMDAQRDRLRAIRQDLERRHESYQNYFVQNAKEEIASQKERIGIIEARLEQMKRDLARKKALRVGDNVSESVLEQAQLAEHTTQHEIDAAKEELNRLQRLRDAAQQGVYLGEGRNDVPYSLQRIDEIDIALADLALKRKEQELKDRKVDAELDDERERMKNLSFVSVRAGFDGVIWRDSVVEGSNVLAGTELVRILDCRELFVDIVVDEISYDDIYPGLDADVRLYGRANAIPAKVMFVRGSRATTEDKTLAAQLPHGTEKYAWVRLRLAPSELNTDYRNFCQIGRSVIVRFAKRTYPIKRWLWGLWFSIF